MKEPTVHGVGVNDADYPVHRTEKINGKRKTVWRCHFYTVWADMIYRCYSLAGLRNNPTYLGCSVCEEWLRFSNFKAWMEKQDWEGNYLDKDILKIGNKIYSPEFCVFVSRQVNNFVLERNSLRGKYKIGAHLEKQTGRFRVGCRNPFTGGSELLGRFDTEDEAHLAWLSKKLEHARRIASLQKDSRVAKALIDRYENYVIT